MAEIETTAKGNEGVLPTVFGSGNAATGAKKKRGILFTVSVMLLSISLLGFAIALSSQAAKNKIAATQLSDIDRVTDAYSNLEGMAVKVAGESVNFSVANSTVFISESLPYSPQIAVDLDNLAAFESNLTDQNMNAGANFTNMKAGSFLIQPNGIAITHSAGKVDIVPQNSPGSAGAVQRYEVNLTFPAGSIDSAQWEYQSTVANDSPSALPVHVRVQDASYAINLDFYATLDKYGASRLNITQAGGLVGYVAFNSPAQIEAQYADKMGLKASVGLSNPAYVEANDAVWVASAANKTGRVRIA